MERAANCGLCRDLNSPTVLLETENFVTLPGIGQFWENGGYLLIVTKDHAYTSSAAFTKEMFSELEFIMREAAQIVHDVYKEAPTFFEHGSTCHSKAGQCVTHMHMNLVPRSLDFTKYLHPDQRRELGSIAELSEVPAPYLYVRTPEGKDLACPVGSRQVPSQYLRQAVGIETGHPEPAFWNWRLRYAEDDFEMDENSIENTVNNLRNPFKQISFSRSS